MDIFNARLLRKILNIQREDTTSFVVQCTMYIVQLDIISGAEFFINFVQRPAILKHYTSFFITIIKVFIKFWQ